MFFLKVEYPVVWSVDEFCDSFFKLMDHLELDRVSLDREKDTVLIKDTLLGPSFSLSHIASTFLTTKRTTSL